MKLREFLAFTKSDRSVLIVLLTTVVFAIVAFSGLLQTPSVTSLTDADSLASSHQVSHYSHRFPAERSYYYGQYAQPQAERFPFDPNTADSTALLRLGLRPWQVKNIYKYRARGGKYRTPEDFASVYGLTTSEFESLRPMIRIQEDFTPAAEVYARQERDTVLFPEKLKSGEYVSLNAADTAALKRIPGIGSYFARQIVSYRQRLGGFYSKEQLLEIEGFPEEALPYIQVDAQSVKTLPINRLTLNQLKRHPYLNFYQARAITDYRRLHGQLESIDQLRLMQEFSEEDLQHLRQYLSFE